MDTRQQRRLAENESRFRDMNEHINGAVAGFREGADSMFSIMCECAISECQDMIDLSADEYGQVRSNARWFAVLPDHVIESAEVPVEKTGRYWIVEKIGGGADLAESRA